MKDWKASKVHTAKQFRRDKDLRGGYIFVFGSQVVGWHMQLPPPDYFIPDTIAVGASGEVWVATGGDDYDGATIWIHEHGATA